MRDVATVMTTPLPPIATSGQFTLHITPESPDDMAESLVPRPSSVQIPDAKIQRFVRAITLLFGSL